MLINMTFKNWSVSGTYSQEQHAVHGERGVAGVERQPATERQKHGSTLCYVLKQLETNERILRHVVESLLFTHGILTHLCLGV